MILFLKAKLPFGKHEDENVKDVIDTDLQYMIWFRDNVHVTLDNEVKDYIEDHINELPDCECEIDTY